MCQSRQADVSFLVHDSRSLVVLDAEQILVDIQVIVPTALLAKCHGPSSIDLSMALNKGAVGEQSIAVDGRFGAACELAFDIVW